MVLCYNDKAISSLILLLMAVQCSAFTSSPLLSFGKTRQQFNSIDENVVLYMASNNVGIFFGTSTGTTEDIAERIKDTLGDECDAVSGPFDVDDLDGSVKDNFEKYDCLIVGTPTWNTGADTERSGTGWDEIYYTDMADDDLNLKGKKVAVFGCGDQISYSENFADATGELYDVFQNLGANMGYGYTSTDGYEHEASKSIRFDDDGNEKFCGLLCDGVNQEDMTESRVQNWIDQLKTEGFLDETSAAAGASDDAKTTAAAATPSAQDTIDAEIIVEEEIKKNDVDVEEISASVFQNIDENSNILDETIEQYGAGGGATRNDNNGFRPYYNENTKSTMYVSADGRSCYYVTADPTTHTTSVSP